jgi:outer membrane protein TolC
MRTIEPSTTRRTGCTRRLALWGLTPLVLALGGCASLATDGGLEGVRAHTAAHSATQLAGGPLQWARTADERRAASDRVNELLAQPLDAERAVQVALLNHRGLQAAYAEVGISDADRVQATRLTNPGFSFGRSRQGDEREIERGIHVNLARLVFMPTLSRLSEQQLQQTQLRVAQQALQVAAEARKAYYEAVAAQERRRYMQQVMQAAEASATLAQRMAQVGNFNRLQQAREQGFHAEAALGLARAQRAEHAARERLIRALGLWGAQTAFKLPERLPDLPATLPERPEVEREAMTQRLDVKAAVAATQSTAANLGLTRQTRLINVLEVGASRASSNEEPSKTGWEVSLELPLFDWGSARVARAEAVYLQAVDRAAEAAIRARSEVREAYVNHRTAHDIARHLRDEVVPLQQRISEENLLRYNGMLIGVFDLLADARAQVHSVAAYLDALRDFWLAQADLDLAMVASPNLSAPSSGSAPAMAAGGDPH